MYRDYRNETMEIVKLWQVTDMGSPERGDTADAINRTI